MRKLFTLKALWCAIFCISITGNIYAVGDAGVQAFPTPVSPVCKGSASVSAIIHNYGGNTISTVTVNWRVNGSLQTAYSFSGIIAAGNEDTVVLGNFTFTSGAYTVEAWTSNPNGGSDSDVSNDSASAVVNVSGQLTGTYTIGGTSPDYATFNLAVSALVTNGVCGPVTFNIRPGTDTMQCIIPQIAGVDSTNNITFKSQNGDSTSVVLTYPSQDTTILNYLIKLNGADYITFRSLTLQRSSNHPNGRVVEFTNNATHNTIRNCRLLGSSAVFDTVTNSLAAVIYSSAGTTFNDSMNTFNNNYIVDGSLGIYMNGISNLSLEYGTAIRDNVFLNQFSKGIQMSNEANVVISGNVFTTTSNYPGFAAIYLDRALRTLSITKNKITGVPGTGLYMVDCVAQIAARGVIANNFIQSNDSAGISMVNGDNQDIVFNSINMTGSTSSFSALFMRGSGSGKTVKNNILANSGGGYAYVVSDSAVFGITISDNNNLYKNTGSFVGNYNGTNITTLANWVAASGKDSNSVAVNPNFATPADLHVTSIAMDDRGKPVAGVADDIDGQVRSSLTPDIGADEYASVSRNVGVIGLVSPIDGQCGNANMVIKVLVANTGGFTEQNFNVRTQITGSLNHNQTQNHSATLTAGSIDTLTYSATINTAAGGTYHFKIFTQLNVDDVNSNDTLDVDITLNPPPTAPGASNQSICGPGSGVLTATSTDTIRWYGAAVGGTLLGTGSPFTTPAITNTTTFYVAAKSACEGPRTSVTLSVLPVPTVNLGNDTSINQGSSVTLNAGAGMTAYLWSTGATTQTINVNADGCYWAIVTNGAGCHDTDTVCVDVIAPNDMSVTAISSPANHDCTDDSTQVLIHVSNLGTNTATNIPVTVTITGIVTTTRRDTITSTMNAGADVVLNLGYINTTPGGAIIITAYTSYANDSDRTNDTLIVHDTLIVAPATPAGNSASRCGRGNISLSASSTTDSVYWYDAMTGGNLVFTGDVYNIPGLSTTTTFYAQAGQHCNTQVRRAVTATINQPPPVDLGIDRSANDSLVLDAGAGYTSYAWSNLSTTQTITVYASAAYSVCVTDSFGCSNCDTINITIVTGIEQLMAGGDINLYPNPAHSSLTIEMKKMVNGKISISMTDIQGQQLYYDEQNNFTSKILNVSSYAKGIYYLHIRSEAGLSVYRVIIE